jgi:hypothetical protein
MENRNFNRDWDQDADDWYPGSYGEYNRNRNWYGPNRGNYNRGYYQSNRDQDYYSGNWDQGYNQGRGYNQTNWNQGYNQTGYNRNFNQRNYSNQNRFNRGGYNPNYDYDYDNDYWDYNTNPNWTYWEYWYVPGPFMGIGPSGYQRSDERICDDIHNRMTQHGQLDASDIQVDVNNGEVTLNGNVPDRRQKRLAEDIADSVTGVTDVQNNLHIERGRQGKTRGQQNQQGRQSQQQGQSQSGMQHKQTNKGEISRGMKVMGSDGKQAGTVKDILNDTFLLNRSMDRDVFVPFSAIQNIQNNQIQLNVKADDVDNQGWQEPQVAGIGGGQQGR